MNYAQNTNTDPRVLVISGGGARGAWGGGLAEALYLEGNRYQIVVGTSTGSLLAPLVAIDSFSSLKYAYTNVTHKDIFNVRPFKTKGKNKGKIRGLNALWRIITCRKTLGESKKLRKTIKEYFTPKIFEEIRNSPDRLEIIATVINLEKDQIEYKSSNDFSYEEMVDWIWASGNQPVFMSLLKRKDEYGNKYHYVDGGVKENIPLREAIRAAQRIGASNIDVIVHSTDRPQAKALNELSILKLLIKTIDLFSTEIRHNDVDIARLLDECTTMMCDPSLSTQRDVITITIYYMPSEHYNMLPNSLMFEKDTMSKLWEEGNRFLNRTDIDQYIFRYYIQNGKVLPVDLPVEFIAKDRR